jgi:hypothetical protein
MATRGTARLANVMSRLAVVLLAIAALAAAAAPASAITTRTGASRSDTLTGTSGPDVLEGRGGDDDLYGAGGGDVLSGGAGGDQLLGGAGRDVLSGGRGNDQVHADDGTADVVSCGLGTDVFFADRFDVVGRNCEIDGRAALRGGALATFGVVGERFRVWVTTPRTIWDLRELAAGRSLANIPAGSVRRGPGRAGHNRPFSWHLDPADTVQGEMAIEVCDATPSYLEDNREEFVEVVRTYCPWGARLVELRNYGGRAEPPSSGPRPGPVELPDEGPR